MKKNYLAAWSTGDLSDSELAQIEGEEALHRYLKIKNTALTLSIDLPKTLEWNAFSRKLAPKKAAKTISLTWVYSIAASLILLIGISGFFFSHKNYSALNSFVQIELPDGSVAKLTPGAELSHRRSFGWTNRTLTMSGEIAYQVKKGKPFIVKSTHGSVQVLGTAFKVLDTSDFFEVVCTEGRVKVNHQEKAYFLSKGFSFNPIDQKVTEFDLSRYKSTSTCYYSRVPLNYIINLVENLYGLKIELKSNKSYYFTGVIPLNDQEKALRSLSLPFSFQVEEHENDTLILVEE